MRSADIRSATSSRSSAGRRTCRKVRRDADPGRRAAFYRRLPVWDAEQLRLAIAAAGGSLCRHRPVLLPAPPMGYRSLQPCLHLRIPHSATRQRYPCLPRIGSRISLRRALRFGQRRVALRNSNRVLGGHVVQGAFLEQSAYGHESGHPFRTFDHGTSEGYG